MTMEQLYRDECDTIRLLIDEFEHTGAEHFVKNMEAINAVQARDWNEYVKPVVIPAIFGFLTGSLLIHCMSLLEYRLPILVMHHFTSSGKLVPEPFETFRKGNVLAWTKKVLATSDGVNFDFDDGLFQRLNAWIRLRNDEVHNGGYRGPRITKSQIDTLPGVIAGDIGTLYDVQFVACRNAITDVETFFLKVDDALKTLK